MAVARRRSRRTVNFIDTTIEFLGDKFVEEDDDWFLSADSGTSINDSFTSMTASEISEENHRKKYQNELRYSATVPIEWYGAKIYPPGVGFDLETWWRRSRPKTRLLAFFLGIILFFLIAYLLAATSLVYFHFIKPVRNPYTCSGICNQAHDWIRSTMNLSVDPCDNFYEFACGSYKELAGNELYYYELLDVPTFKMEFGVRAVLSKILKNYRNETYSQEVKFYQACLNEPNRRVFALKSFYDKIETIFGTRDFNNFETSTTKSMEEIGGDLFRAMGQTMFINIAFYSFPYIQIVRPSKLLNHPHSTFTAEDTTFFTNIFNKLMGNLSVPENSSIVEEMVKGIKLMRDIHKGASTGDQQAVGGMCPPMGISVDVDKILENFLLEEHKVDYLDLWTKKYVTVIRACFNSPSEQFTSRQEFTHPKTAFVAIWIFGLFYDFSMSMDITMLRDWGVLDEYRRSGYIPDLKPLLWEYGIQLRCLNSLWFALGYYPSIRFVISSNERPQEYNEHFEEVIEKMYEHVRKTFRRIPTSEIGYKEALLGHSILDRSFHTDAIVPLVGELIDLALDPLNFTDDHLRNTFIAVSYTVEKARHNWMASSSPLPVIKWWGHGDSLRTRLLDLHAPFISPATLIDEEEALQNQKYKQFLGRSVPNYILYPLSILDEPHHLQTLAIDSGSVTFKYIRSMFNLVDYTLPNTDYDSYNMRNFSNFEGLGNESVSNRTCYLLQDGGPFEQNRSDDLSYLYQYKVANSNVIDYTWNKRYNFYTLLALKESFNLYEEGKKRYYNMPNFWNITDQERIFKLHRFIPGQDISNFTDDQLFFIAFVRHACRESWKINELEKEKRYQLEAYTLSVLMQMKEFSDTFQCATNTRMHNMFGKTRCFQWVP